MPRESQRGTGQPFPQSCLDSETPRIDLEEEDRSLDSMASVEPTQRLLQNQEALLLGPLPHLSAPTKSSTPNILCSHPLPTPSPGVWSSRI